MGNEILQVAGVPAAMKSALRNFQTLAIQLTGQRHMKGTKSELAKKHLEENTPGREMKQAEHLSAVTPEFNTLGALRPHAGARLTPVEEAPKPGIDCRAVVLWFLGGSADTCDLFVLVEDTLLREGYLEHRVTLALSKSDHPNLAGKHLTIGIGANFNFVR